MVIAAYSWSQSDLPALEIFPAQKQALLVHTSFIAFLRVLSEELKGGHLLQTFVPTVFQERYIPSGGNKCWSVCRKAMKYFFFCFCGSSVK